MRARKYDHAAPTTIEPDDCFYIQHQAEMVGKDRIDLAVDPPPDLVIEIDVASTTALQAYEALQVKAILADATRCGSPPRSITNCRIPPGS